ncbi:hypothetical protein ONZ43_g6238 [Nemania bipapillata]|uniref:Uncharacterized protein n=1 Tax=Nemania bipapillata TaxID=110536 RepID=A0ACC2I2V7_9PEZI|nr:hypothetical protein ONZ43_g6238 [Nemania bipapillata]
MAVKNARRQNILMFGAASDQGVKYTDLPYMAKLAQVGFGDVICIGGARELGRADEKSRNEGEFFFPGQTNGMPAPLPSLRSSFGEKTGSSVATALAAGFTALIMLLVNMSDEYGGRVDTEPRSPPPKYRTQLQDPNHVRKIFKNLLRDPETNRPNGEIQSDLVIPVHECFETDGLKRQYFHVPENERAKKGEKLLDVVLEQILW